MRHVTPLSLMLTTALALSGCGSDDDTNTAPMDPGMSEPTGMDPTTPDDPTADPAGPGNIVETAAAAGGFESLLAAATKAGLADTLATGGPFTVFAPTDEAFAAALESLGVTLDDLDAETLASILSYHVVSGEVYADDVTSLTVASTVNGSDLRVRLDGGSVYLGAGNGEAQVIATDVEASNGVIHVIDKVMLPPENIAAVATDAGFSSLVAAVVKAELVETLSASGPFTVFAPTDEAFAAALESLGVTLDDLTKEDLTPILTYHVVPGKLYSEDVIGVSSATTVQGAEISVAIVDGGVTLNDTVNVISTDVLAENGVIHIIDGVLLPPAN